MNSLADRMLAGGCVAHVAAFHGGTFTVLSGERAGQSCAFNAIDSEPDQIVNTDLAEDPRGSRMLRLPETVAVFATPTHIQTPDGKFWLITKADYSSYLTHDYHMKELTSLDA
jgi:hypothetical protein